MNCSPALSILGIICLWHCTNESLYSRDVIFSNDRVEREIEFGPNAPEDKEYLADLVLVALSDAYAQADAQLKGQMGDMLGNIDLSQIANLFRK